MVSRGFGVAGALDHGIIQQLAQAAESSGYTSFWVNDTPNGDGLAALAAAPEVTRSIRLGVGVIPVDRQPSHTIAARTRELALPLNRLVIGVGSGATRQGGLALVQSAVEDLSQRLGVPIVVGALGPRMCRLSATTADGALLNWLTPAMASETYASIAAVAAENSRPGPFIAGYVRTAFGDESLTRLREEAARYERIPQYARHFASMGVSAVATSVTGRSREELQSRLLPYDEALDETVIRAITAQDEGEQYLALLQAAAPS